jgi:hypothetical protein
VERVAFFEWQGLGKIGGIQYLGGRKLDVDNTLAFKLSNLRCGCQGKQQERKNSSALPKQLLILLIGSGGDH